MKGSPDAGITPKPSPKLSSPVKSVYQDVTSVENITDEVTLNKYLKEHEKHEKNTKVVNKTQQSNNLLSSFWSHSVTKTAKDMSSFLKKCQYQLATLAPGNVYMHIYLNKKLMETVASDILLEHFSLIRTSLHTAGNCFDINPSFLSKCQ